MCNSKKNNYETFVKSYLRKQQSQFVMDLKKVFINKNGVSGIPHMPV